MSSRGPAHPVKRITGACYAATQTGALVGIRTNGIISGDVAIITDQGQVRFISEPYYNIIVQETCTAKCVLLYFKENLGISADRAARHFFLSSCCCTCITSPAT